MRTTVLTLAVVLGTSVFASDESVVNFDTTYNFSTVKRFALQSGVIGSQKPEINNRLFVQRMDESIRLALTGKGLTEDAQKPDVKVTYTIAGKDYSTPGTRRRVTPTGSGARADVVSTGPQLLTEGTLLIDITQASDDALLWRGTFRDEERSGPSLSRRLPDDAAKLLSKLPVRK